MASARSQLLLGLDWPLEIPVDLPLMVVLQLTSLPTYQGFLHQIISSICLKPL